MADKKITDLTEETTAADNEPLAIVQDPGGGGVETKKIQVKNLLRKSYTLVVAPTGMGGADYYTDGTADEVQINQAIVDLLTKGYSGGGRVVLREGLYSISDTIYIPRSDIVLEGQGPMSKIFLANAANKDMIRFGHGATLNRTDISFSNANPDTITTAAGNFITSGFVAGERITISGSASNNGTFTIASLTATVITLISTDTLTNESAGASVTLTPALTLRSKVKNVYLDGNMANQTTGGFGIKIEYRVGYCEISDNTIKNTLFSNIIMDDTAAVSGAEHNEVLRNLLDTTGPGQGSSNIDGGQMGFIVRGNTCIGGGYGNIALYGGNAAERVVVEDNLCIDAGDEGPNAIVVNGQGIISRNHVVNPNGTGEVILSEANNSIVQDNVVEILTSDPVGPVIKTAGHHVSIANNVIHVEASSTVALIGIQSTTNCVVTGNDISFENDEANVAISTGGVSEQQIVGNSMTNTGSRPGGAMGISMSASTEITVTGNYIQGFNTGIDASSVIDVTISGNTIWDNDLSVDISEAQSLAITGNSFEAQGLSENFIASTSNNYTEHVAITGNSFYNAGGGDIVLRSCRYCVVSGNNFRDSDGDAAVKLNTVSGTNYSHHNTIDGNVFAGGGPDFIIRENSVNDGPNIITSNIALGATMSQISTQHGSSVVANNITT